MSNWTYIVLLGAVVVVVSLFLPKKQQPAQGSNDTRNMEIALEQFMENTELDHQEMVKLVTVLREEGKQQAEVNGQRLLELSNRCQLLEQQVATLQQQNDRLAAQAMPIAVPSQHATEADKLAIMGLEPEPAVSSIQMRYAELFELYHQGKSIEAIAKKMNMNKGEVQLILQLAKQEEKANV
ncbi:DUF6115 domain-containing protein [Paenibacillus glycanilyticus]|uniref:RNA polymerase subunit sigma-70 n=1 Tax=Paenibacillus glycanilyticus TaxID=126569 RepID=A0ABQ6GE24_9BACL|nr:hypothetical protein [Paenibacillus glycanilyticus]GLX68510.1 hypothetical protein MU1_28550 [Paenibacillus glycanilyticus]